MPSKAKPEVGAGGGPRAAGVWHECILLLKLIFDKKVMFDPGRAGVRRRQSTRMIASLAGSGPGAEFGNIDHTDTDEHQKYRYTNLFVQLQTRNNRQRSCPDF